MTCAESIIGALSQAWEWCRTLRCSNRQHGFATTGQNLVWVGLVTHVPDKAVFRGIEAVVQCDGQFDHAETGTEVTAGLANAVEQVVSELLRQRIQLG